MKELADMRYSWIHVFTDLRDVLMQAEAAEKANLAKPDNGGSNTDTGVWVEQFEPIMPNGSPFAASEQGGDPSAVTPVKQKHTHRPHLNDAAALPAVTASAVPAAGINDIVDVKLHCSGINRNNLSPTANHDLAYIVRQKATNNPSFKDAALVGELRVDDGDTNTFTFLMTVRLAHPLRLIDPGPQAPLGQYMTATPTRLRF
jgi:hypothetical protein